ncbi:MAG: hypothetical protein K0R29_1390 [Pseudobdellovibrio sp.]|jgi:hypothetical protein|nr:hypothetical protein [Pseudobdellovibrio sp.]
MLYTGLKGVRVSYNQMLRVGCGQVYGLHEYTRRGVYENVFGFVSEFIFASCAFS